MDRYSSWRDHYCYPGSSVLINRYNIRDSEQLEAAERSVTALTISHITLFHPPFSLNTLSTIHRTLFAELYSWAGDIRDIAISKGNTRFCQPMFIRREAEQLFRKMEIESWLSGLGHREFCQRLAWYYGELNILHPFREGNGRTLRILFEHIALHAGFRIDWSELRIEDWLKANILAYEIGPEALNALFLQHVFVLPET
ncbi:putative adenosine monophosphate-protein transferase Fic [Enterobacteriaceae bacterium RIT697]|nr:putative adenosine monophosphate-protein transferase Fic [Enterobacteriaceae bacterium RIT697]